MRAIAFFATFLAVAGCVPQKNTGKTPDTTQTAESFPWTLEEAKKKMMGKSKEEVIALFGKPDEVSDHFYYYREPKYLKPDVGAKDGKVTGMSLTFIDSKLASVGRP